MFADVSNNKDNVIGFHAIKTNIKFSSLCFTEEVFKKENISSCLLNDKHNKN